MITLFSIDLYESAVLAGGPFEGLGLLGPGHAVHADAPVLNPEFPLMV